MKKIIVLVVVFFLFLNTTKVYATLEVNTPESIIDSFIKDQLRGKLTNKYFGINEKEKFSPFGNFNEIHPVWIVSKYKVVCLREPDQYYKEYKVVFEAIQIIWFNHGNIIQIKNIFNQQVEMVIVVIKTPIGWIVSKEASRLERFYAPGVPNNCLFSQ